MREIENKISIIFSNGKLYDQKASKFLLFPNNLINQTLMKKCNNLKLS